MPEADDPAERRRWTLYHSGERSLDERLYREAETTLSKYLSQQPRTVASAASRARAHALIALAVLARTPPLSRSTREVNHVVSRLRNAQELPLAQVLAALIIETFYETDEWNVPQALRAVAQKCSVNDLDQADLRLLVQHLPGMFGETWEQIRRGAGFYGLSDEPPAPVDEARVDDWRRKAVRRYFAQIPRKPEEPQWRLASSLFAGAVASGVLPCGGLYIRTRWYVGLPSVLALYFVAAVLLFFAVVTVQESRVAQKKIRERNAAIAATQPQASIAELDAWLQGEVERAKRLGAAVHRLNLTLGIENAGLLMAPQVIVGISELPGPYSVERREQDPTSPTGSRTVIRRLPLAKSRIGTDQQLRASHYHILVTYLSERRIGVFECDVDLATGHILAQSTHAFSYDDVVTMSSQKVAANSSREHANVLVDAAGNSVTLFGDNRFVMSLVNGHSIEVSTAVRDGAGPDTGIAIAWKNDQVQRSIERMVWALKDSRVA